MKTKIVVRIIICLVILFLGCYFYFKFSSTHREIKSKKDINSLKSVIVAPLKKVDYNLKVTGYGTAYSTDVFKISSQVSGELKYKTAILKEGNVINRDDVLLRIDSADYQLQLKEIDAEINVFKIKNNILDRGIADNKNIYKSLYRSFQIEEKEYHRQKELYSKNAVSLKQLESTERSLETAKSACFKKDSEIKQEELELNLNLASIEKNIAKREKILLDIERCEIKAPVTGRITEVNIGEKEYIKSGQNLFAVVDDLSLSIPVSLNNSESESLLKANEISHNHWYKLRDNIGVKIQWTEKLLECEWSGKILRIEKYDSNTRTFTFIVAPEKPLNMKNVSMALTSGMFCKVIFTLPESVKVYKIPSSSIQFNGKIYLVDPENIISESSVDIISSDSDYLYVKCSFPENYNIVTQQIPRGIVNGMKVKPIIKETKIY